MSRIFFQAILRSETQLGIDAKAVNDLIARNARVAQDRIVFRLTCGMEIES